MPVTVRPTVTPTNTVTLTNKTLTNPTVNFTDNAATQNVKCRVYLSSIQTNLTDSAWTKVLFVSENYDIGGDFDTTNSRFVAPVTGYYLVNLCVAYDSASVIADKRYAAGVYINGALTSLNTQSSSAAVMVSPAVSDVFYVVAGQYIEGYARVITGANTVDIYGDAGGSPFTFMSIHLLSV